MSKDGKPLFPAVFLWKVDQSRPYYVNIDKDFTCADTPVLYLILIIFRKQVDNLLLAEVTVLSGELSKITNILAF